MKKWGTLALGVAIAGCAGTGGDATAPEQVTEVPPSEVATAEAVPEKYVQLFPQAQPSFETKNAEVVTGEAGTPELNPLDTSLELPKLPSETATPVKAGSAGWTFFSSANGLPSRIYGVSADEAGNIWVAGGNAGVFVKRANETQFHGHSTPYPAISISGGPAGVAFVGYMGLANCDMAWDTGGSRDVYKSGDADRVWLSGDSLQRQHYDIYSGPGVVAAEPQGREKLCNIFRIVYDKKTSSVWFGGNHGVAWGDPTSSRVVEHTHPAINGYWRAPDGSLHYTLLSGDYQGLAVDDAGNLWLGGRERSAFLPYANNGGNFWAGDNYVQNHKIDVWPDQVPQDPTPSQAVWDDTFGFAPMPDGSTWVGSESQGVALVSASGEPVAHFVQPLIDKSVTAMTTDPRNHSMWAGHGGVNGKGGLTRLVGTTWYQFGSDALGQWSKQRVTDIHVQANGPNGKRRILVAFQNGGVGVFDGD